MSALPIILLTDRNAFWDRMRAQELQWNDLLSLVAFVVLACGLYGAVLAGWRSPRLSVYVSHFGSTFDGQAKKGG